MYNTIFSLAKFGVISKAITHSKNKNTNDCGLVDIMADCETFDKYIDDGDKHNPSQCRAMCSSHETSII